VHPRLLQLGPIAIPTYGVFAALALVAALVAALVVSRRLKLDPNKVWNLGLITLLTDLLGSRLILIAAHLGDFAAHPFWMLGISTVRSHAAVYGGVCLAIAAGLLYTRAAGLPLLRTLDALALAIALGAVVHGIGTFIAGMEYGTPSTLPWSVIYSSRIAALWYGTPLAIRLHPVQLYGSIAQLAIFCLLMAWISRRKQDGELAGGWLFLTGLSTFLLEYLRGDPGGSLFDGAIPVTQLGAVTMVLAGGLLGLERRRTLPEPGTAALAEQPLPQPPVAE
jgi:phosphatidylglycerol:prolipoprotein diacylglycerol transferase